MIQDFEKQLGDIKFDVTRNIMYHGAREGWYARWHKIVMFLATFFGTGAAIVVLQQGPAFWTAAFGLLVAVATTLDLVFDLSGNARIHNGLRQRLFAIMADLEDCVDDSADLGAIRKRLFALYGEEPPQLRALDAICWNQARLALYPDTKYENLLRVRWNEALFKHVWAFPGQDFPPNSQSEQYAAPSA